MAKKEACTKTGCSCKCDGPMVSCKRNVGHCCICAAGCHLGH